VPTSQVRRASVKERRLFGNGSRLLERRLFGRLLPVDPLHSGYSGQITGFHRAGGVHGDAGEREISLFAAEKFHFRVTNFTICVIRHVGSAGRSR
jgi:hypothetical protein